MDHYLTSLATIAAGSGLLGFIVGVFLGGRHGQEVGAESERRRIKRHHMEVMLEQVKVDGEWTPQSRYWYRRLVKPLRNSEPHWLTDPGPPVGNHAAGLVFDDIEQVDNPLAPGAVIRMDKGEI